MELKTLALHSDFSLRRIRYDLVKNFSSHRDLNKTTSNVQQTHISTRWCFTPTTLSVTLWKELQDLHKSNQRLWCERTFRPKSLNQRVPPKVCPRKTKSLEQSLRSQLIRNRKSLTVLESRQFNRRIQVKFKKAQKRKRLYLYSSNS